MCYYWSHAYSFNVEISGVSVAIGNQLWPCSLLIPFQMWSDCWMRVQKGRAAWQPFGDVKETGMHPSFCQIETAVTDLIRLRNCLLGVIIESPFNTMYLGVVTLTFRELSKIILRKYTILEITFMVRISSWNFVRGPKAMLWAHTQSSSLKFS